MPSPRTARRPGLRRHLATTAIVPAALLVLTACGEAKSPAPMQGATAGPVVTAEPTGTTAPDPEAPTSNPAGCPVGGTDIPADAEVAGAGDLDGDGRNDQVWLGLKGDKRLLGVRTASGASFATSFTADQSENQRAGATANRLGDGTSIILLATAYSAVLYAVIDCEIVPTLNVQGNQYEFDLGMNGVGTGVACPKENKKLYLAGYNSEKDDIDNSDLVTRTRIDLSENGARADNGKVTRLGHITYDSPKYFGASGVSCGDVETALEPER